MYHLNRIITQLAISIRFNSIQYLEFASSLFKPGDEFAVFIVELIKAGRHVGRSRTEQALQRQATLLEVCFMVVECKKIVGVW